VIPRFVNHSPDKRITCVVPNEKARGRREAGTGLIRGVLLASARKFRANNTN